jgi:hypothetical protein
VWYNPNLTIVPSVSCVHGPRAKPCSILSLFLIGVLFLVVLVCLLCMCCARCLLRVEDRVVDRKSGSFKKVRAEEHKSSFVLRKASGLLPLHILFLSHTTCMITKFTFNVILHKFVGKMTFLRTWLEFYPLYLGQPFFK